MIAVYLVGIIVFGLWIGRDQKNTRDYFLGSKNIPWWGIGLSIVRDILALHACSIRVESRAGDGSRFLFTLPLGRTAPAPRPASVRFRTGQQEGQGQRR